MNQYFEMLKHYVIPGGQVPRQGVLDIHTLCLYCRLFVEIFVGGPGFVVLIGFCGLAVLIPSIVVSVSILNDANRSGWWLLISLIPLVGSTVLLGFVAQDSQSKKSQGGCNPEDAAA